MKSSPKWGRNSKAICTTCCSETAITLQKILLTGYAMQKSPIGCVQPIQCFRDIADSRSAVCLLTSDFGRYALKGSQSFSSVLVTSTYIRLESFSLIDTEKLAYSRPTHEHGMGPYVSQFNYLAGQQISRYSCMSTLLATPYLGAPLVYVQPLSCSSRWCR